MTFWERLQGILLAYQRGSQNVVGMNRRNVDFVYEHNQRAQYPLVDDKIVCKELLATRGVPMAATLDVCEGLFDVERCLNGLLDEGHFVLKPANGSGGNGVLVVGDRLSEVPAEGGSAPVRRWQTAGGRLHSADDLHHHLASIVFGAFGRKMNDRALIEEKLEPHPLFAELWSDGVCDLRVIVLRGVPLMAMLRVPTARSAGKANLHQGGIGIAVDITSGMTTRASQKGVAITAHPDNDCALLHRQLPVWDDVLDVARACAASVPLGYLGVDIVIDHRERPIVLELNARPGLEIQNVNGKSLYDVLPVEEAS